MPRTAPKHVRVRCCCCPNEVKLGNRYRAGCKGLWENLKSRVDSNGREFQSEDLLCNRCHQKVRKGKVQFAIRSDNDRIGVQAERMEVQAGGVGEQGDGMEVQADEVGEQGDRMEVQVDGMGEQEDGMEVQGDGMGAQAEEFVEADEAEPGPEADEAEPGPEADEAEPGPEADEAEPGPEAGEPLSGEVNHDDGMCRAAEPNSENVDGMNNAVNVSVQKHQQNGNYSDSNTSWFDPREMVAAGFSEADSQELFLLPKRRAERFELPRIAGVGSSQSFCCVCHSTSGRSAIPMEASYHFMCETGIWLPPTNRICPEHIINGRLTEEAALCLRKRAKALATTTASEVTKVFRILTSQSPAQRLDVDRLASDGEYWMLFGVTKKNFDDLYHHIHVHLRDTLNRSSRNALAMFLMKLRLDITQKLLGWLFGCPQEKVSETVWRVKALLDEYFVPHNLGFGHLSRQQALEKHDLQFARSIFKIPPGSLPLLFDCTYLYTEEPSNHAAQKKSFCMFKGRHLLKPMTVCFADGYILDSAGLYYSDTAHNDARILQDMVDQLNGISDFIEEGDYFIVDRGFRDIEETLKSKGYEVRMPACIQKRGKARPTEKAAPTAGTSRKRGSRSSSDQGGDTTKQRQLTTEEANHSKLIMFLRWVVEAAHGRVKNMFCFFDHRIDSNYFRRDCDKKLTSLYRIACAIVNKYQPPLLQDSPAHEVLLRSIETNLDKRNSLMELVIENRLGTIRKAYADVSGRQDLQDFPHLSLEDIRTITATQLPLRKWDRYNESFLRLDRDYGVSYYTHDDSIIRVKLGSKYKSRTNHMLWIQYCKNGETDKITGWYCRCQVGARTLGCCCHVASVLYYLGYKRHLQPDCPDTSYGSGIIDITIRQAQEQGYAESDDDELLDI